MRGRRQQLQCLHASPAVALLRPTSWGCEAAPANHGHPAPPHALPVIPPLLLPPALKLTLLLLLLLDTTCLRHWSCSCFCIFDPLESPTPRGLRAPARRPGDCLIAHPLMPCNCSEQAIKHSNQARCLHKRTWSNLSRRTLSTRPTSRSVHQSRFGAASIRWVSLPAMLSTSDCRTSSHLRCPNRVWLRCIHNRPCSDAVQFIPLNVLASCAANPLAISLVLSVCPARDGWRGRRSPTISTAAPLWRRPKTERHKGATPRCSLNELRPPAANARIFSLLEPGWTAIRAILMLSVDFTDV